MGLLPTWNSLYTGTEKGFRGGPEVKGKKSSTDSAYACGGSSSGCTATGIFAFGVRANVFRGHFQISLDGGLVRGCDHVVKELSSVEILLMPMLMPLKLYHGSISSPPRKPITKVYSLFRKELL